MVPGLHRTARDGRILLLPRRCGAVCMTMILDLRRLAGGVEQVSRRFEAAAFEIPPGDFRIVAPVDLAAEAYKTGSKVRLVGRLTTSLEVACSRCLEPLAVPVEADMD